MSPPISLPWDIPPPELAARLRRAPGFVFLDSSSNRDDEDSRWSLIAAFPSEVVTGRLPDTERLDRVLREHQTEAFDSGIPSPGLFGFVTYEGAYAFGVYHSLLAYDHRHETWHARGQAAEWRDSVGEPPSSGRPAPLPPFLPEMSRDDYCLRVRRARDYIAAGDIYQANLAYRFSASPPPDACPYALYEQLREVSPAPYAAYLDLAGNRILSSSPELFLRIDGRSVTTRPIKGTRPRFADAGADERSAYELQTSPKEIAELVMITDLERNDLGQICSFGSVKVDKLLELERYAQVFHLVSTVTGWLREDCGPVEALAACLPGGSISGAPKKRAREIIAELEPRDRGVYTGCIGYIGFHGSSSFNIAIRTVVAEPDGPWHFHVGAGIVADSVPQLEHEETRHKAAGILQAIARYNRSCVAAIGRSPAPPSVPRPDLPISSTPGTAQ